MGIEPTTTWLKATRSTTELRRPVDTEIIQYHITQNSNGDFFRHKIQTYSIKVVVLIFCIEKYGKFVWKIKGNM